MTRLLIAVPWSAGIRGSTPVVEMNCIARLLDHVLSRCLRTSARIQRQARKADILPANRIILWMKDYSAGDLDVRFALRIYIAYPAAWMTGALRKYTVSPLEASFRTAHHYRT